ncbi:MAG: hypothetical protein EAZ08_11170 [Cytophagales bacterium]|nr:MAG: hypothetical protein EAZ08_11170 [Cytophagales bacterium]
MTKQRRLFSVYLIYFIFALLMHSLLITIEQSIYLYAIDTSKAFILLVMNYIGVLVAPIFFTSVLAKIKYKHLSIALLAFVGIFCVFMPFAKDLYFPKFLAMLIGFAYSCVRISSYAFLKTIEQEESLYVSLLNKLDAMFALGFVVTWLMLGASVSLGISWLAFYWLTSGLILISILVFIFTQFDELAQPKTMQVVVYRLADSLAVLKDPQIIINRSVIFFKDVLDSVLAIPKFLYYSMMIMFSLCVVLISIIQMHFVKYTPYLSVLFNNLPSINAYLLISTFFAIFLGRVFVSFIIPIFSAVPVLIASLLALIGVTILLSFQTDTLIEASSIAQFNDLPSAFWLVPMIGFVWAPVMPTLCGVVLYHIDTKRIYHIAGLVILIIFGIEAVWDDISSAIFDQFNLNIALILGVIPIILLMIISVLFLNDLKNKEQGNTTEAGQMNTEELTISIK